MIFLFKFIINLLFSSVTALVDMRSTNEDDCKTMGLSPLNEADDLPLTDVYVVTIIVIIIIIIIIIIVLPVLLLICIKAEVNSLFGPRAKVYYF